MTSQPERYPQRAFRLPPDATEVVLVRHGASQDAVPGEPFEMLEGHADPPLAPAGREQAEAVCARLRAEGIDRVFVTTLRRTAETAAPLGIEPHVVADLREVNLGEWEGGELRIRAAKGDPRLAEIFAEERWDVIPGAESMETFAERVRRGLRYVIAQSGPGATVAAVVHGGVIGEICHQATASRRFAFIHADNASITRVVAFGDGRLLLRSFNDISHLG